MSKRYAVITAVAGTSYVDTFVSFDEAINNALACKEMGWPVAVVDLETGEDWQ